MGKAVEVGPTHERCRALVYALYAKSFGNNTRAVLYPVSLRGLALLLKFHGFA